LTEQKLRQEQEAAKEKMQLDLEYQKQLKDVQQNSSNPSVMTAQASGGI
jgi:nucleoside recognition membrane protein YjiH